MKVIPLISDSPSLTMDLHQGTQNQAVKNEDPPGQSELKSPERRPQRVRCGVSKHFGVLRPVSHYGYIRASVGCGVTEDT